MGDCLQPVLFRLCDTEGKLLALGRIFKIFQVEDFIGGLATPGDAELDHVDSDVFNFLQLFIAPTDVGHGWVANDSDEILITSPATILGFSIFGLFVFASRDEIGKWRRECGFDDYLAWLALGIDARGPSCGSAIRGDAVVRYPVVNILQLAGWQDDRARFGDVQSRAANTTDREACCRDGAARNLDVTIMATGA